MSIAASSVRANLIQASASFGEKKRISSAVRRGSAQIASEAPSGSSKVDHNRVFNMAVKILENENGFDRKCFQIAQSLCGILAVVQCDGSACVGGASSGGTLRRNQFVAVRDDDFQRGLNKAIEMNWLRTYKHDRYTYELTNAGAAELAKFSTLPRPTI